MGIMKTQIEDYGYVVTKLEAKDVAKLITTYYQRSDEDFIMLFNAVLKVFSNSGVGTRQDCLEKMLRGHLSKKHADKIVNQLRALNDNGVWA